MKAVIYARYSPGPNQTDQSIEGQLRECTQFAKNNDISVVGTYIDRAQTGRNDNRADFQKMLLDSERKLFDAVIVWKIDRFGRNREEIAINKVKFRKNGVKVLYAMEHIPEGPEGIILESVLEGLAEYYSANLKQNVIRGMRESAIKCQSNGSGRALGYTIGKDKRFYINNEEAAVVRKIFEMFDNCETETSILRYLKERDIKTNCSNDFRHTSISRILSNRKYIGEYAWQDIVIPNGVPKIIDDALFERVQNRMAKTKKAPARKVGDLEFLLTTKIFCGHCGSTMTGDSGTGKNGNKWYYYTCRGKKAFHNHCTKKSVRKEFIERAVVEKTATVILQDDVIDYIADRVVKIQCAESADRSMLKYYENQLKETDSAIKNIMKVIEQGIITDTTRERLLELESTQKDLKVEIIRENITRPIIEKEQVVYFLEKFKGGNIDDKVYQRKIIDMFVNKVILYDDKIIISYNYSGTKNEVSFKIVEESASDAASECSDKLPLAPPKWRHSKNGAITHLFGFSLCNAAFSAISYFIILHDILSF